MGTAWEHLRVLSAFPQTSSSSSDFQLPHLRFPATPAQIFSSRSSDFQLRQPPCSSVQPSSAQRIAAQPSSPDSSKNSKSAGLPGDAHFPYETIGWRPLFPPERILAFLSLSEPFHPSSAQLSPRQPSSGQLRTMKGACWVHRRVIRASFRDRLGLILG